MRRGLRHVQGRTLIIVLAILTGILAGVAAWLLRVLIGLVTRGWLSLLGVHPGWAWTVLTLPAAGLVLVVMFQRYVVRDDMNNSEARLRKAFRGGHYRLGWHLLWGPLAACPVTLGFGGSAGSEGPAAVMGAAGGSILGRIAGCGSLMMRTLVACGSGAGIAGIFTAPIAGVMFAVEVLKIELTSFAILLLFVSCICAAGTSYVLAGSTLNLTFFVDHTPPLGETWVFLLFGVCCGLYSCYYTMTVRLTSRQLGRIPGWWRTVSAGLILGGMVYLLPALYGEGYGVIRHLESYSTDYAFLVPRMLWEGMRTMGVPVLIVAGVLLALKGVAVNLTNSGGGVAGVFTPAMMAGALLGLLFAQLCNTLFGWGLELPLYAFVGMAGVMSGALKAPLLGTFVATEVSGCYLLILPVAVVAFASYYVRMRLSPGDVIMSPSQLLAWNPYR